MLDESSIDSRITGVWCRFNNLGKMSTATLVEIKDFAISKGLIITNITETEFGSSPSIKAVLLGTTVGTALLPRESISQINMYQRNVIPFKNSEDFWKAVDWFVPPYINNGQLRKAFDFTGVAPKNFRNSDELIIQKRFDSAFSELYSLSNIIPITLQILPSSAAISPHLPIIKESILAFYSGMQVSSIAALIPIIENVMRVMIGEGAESLDTTSKVNRCIDMACEKVLKIHFNNADWIPSDYYEIEFLKVTNYRIFMLESIRHWLINSFYANDKNYNKVSGFNRHHFAHALSGVWQNKSNFFRALGLLQAMAFIECFATEGSSVSIFNPIPDERSKSFHAEVLACLQAQILKKHLVENFQRTNELPHNVTASDDGWLLRAAVLSEKMNNEIITSLRDNGWQCFNFCNAIKDGEYITVDAKRNGKEIKVVLLYSCATSKEAYAKLNDECDYILFLGASYYINDFAKDIVKPVMPLNAWIAP